MRHGTIKRSPAPKVPAPSRTRRPKSRVRHLRALLAIADTAAQSLSTEKILSDTLDKSLEVLGFDVGYIRILDPEKKRMVGRVSKGLTALSSGSVDLADSSRRHVANILFETQKPYISPDVRKDTTFKNRTMEKQGVISAAYIPIISKKKTVLGTLAVGSRKLRKFSPEKISLLQTFGSQLGMALENAQLYDEVHRGKAYIENLVENAADIILSTDLEDQNSYLESRRRSHIRLQQRRSDRETSFNAAAATTCTRTCGDACQGRTLRRPSGH